MALEPLEVFALDSSMRRVTGSIPYESLIWRRRYRECGSFEMVVPASAYDRSWAYVYCDERPETGIVQKVEASDEDWGSESSAGADAVTVSGYFLEARLNDFVFLAEDVEDFEWRYEPPPTRTFDPAPKERPKAWVSDGGFVYTEGPSGELAGYDPANHAKKPLASSQANDDGSVTVTDLSGATYTVRPLDYDNTPNHYLYTDRDDEGDHLYSVGFDPGSGEATAPGNEEAEWDEWVTDDSGSTWRRHNGAGEEGRWMRASGVVERELVRDSYHQTEEYKYFAKLRRWRASTDHGWYTVPVRGPWQRTDLGDSARTDDVAAHLTDYVQMFFQNTMQYAEPAFECEGRAINPSLKRLGDVLYEELQPDGASFRVVYDFAQDAYLFEIWRGIDRTQSQSEAPWAVFSEAWGTLYGFRALEDASNYRNLCYVLYDYDEPIDVVSVYENSYLDPHSKLGNDYARPMAPGELKGYAIRYRRARGYATARLDDGRPDAEVYLDLRDEKPEFDGDWSRDVHPTDEMPSISALRARYAEHAKTFEPRGLALLESDYGVVRSLDTGTLSAEGYMRGWDLGDKVDMAAESLGLASEGRIIGVDEAYDASRRDISVMIGDEVLTSAQRARML